MLPEPLCISGTRSANDTHAKKKKEKKKSWGGKRGAARHNLHAAVHAHA